MSASSGTFVQGWFQIGTLCRLATPDLEWRAANGCVWACVCAVYCVHMYGHVCTCVFLHLPQVRVCKRCRWCVCCLHVYAVWLYSHTCVYMCMCICGVYMCMCICGVYCVQAHAYVHMCTCAHVRACVPSGEERKDTGHTLVMVASPARGLLRTPAPPWLGSRMEGTQAQEGSWLRCLASCSDSLKGMDVTGGSLAR